MSGLRGGSTIKCVLEKYSNRLFDTTRPLELASDFWSLPVVDAPSWTGLDRAQIRSSGISKSTMEQIFNE